MFGIAQLTKSEVKSYRQLPWFCSISVCIRCIAIMWYCLRLWTCSHTVTVYGAGLRSSEHLSLKDALKELLKLVNGKRGGTWMLSVSVKQTMTKSCTQHSLTTAQTTNTTTHPVYSLFMTHTFPCWKRTLSVVCCRRTRVKTTWRKELSCLRSMHLRYRCTLHRRTTRNSRFLIDLI